MLPNRPCSAIAKVVHGRKSNSGPGGPFAGRDDRGPLPDPPRRRTARPYRPRPAPQTRPRLALGHRSRHRVRSAPHRPLADHLARNQPSHRPEDPEHAHPARQPGATHATSPISRPRPPHTRHHSDTLEPREISRLAWEPASGVRVERHAAPLDRAQLLTGLWAWFWARTHV